MCNHFWRVYRRLSYLHVATAAFWFLIFLWPCLSGFRGIIQGMWDKPFRQGLFVGPRKLCILAAAALNPEVGSTSDPSAEITETKAGRCTCSKPRPPKLIGRPACNLRLSSHVPKLLRPRACPSQARVLSRQPGETITPWTGSILLGILHLISAHLINNYLCLNLQSSPKQQNQILWAFLIRMVCTWMNTSIDEYDDMMVWYLFWWAFT